MYFVQHQQRPKIIHWETRIKLFIPVWSVNNVGQSVLEKLLVAMLARKTPPFMKPKVVYCVHVNPPLDPFLSQINPVHNFTPCFFKICFNIILPSSSSCSKWSVRFRLFAKKTYMFFSFLHAFCIAFPSLFSWFGRLKCTNHDALHFAVYSYLWFNSLKLVGLYSFLKSPSWLQVSIRREDD